MKNGTMPSMCVYLPPMNKLQIRFGIRQELFACSVLDDGKSQDFCSVVTNCTHCNTH